jgi:hypothetical protein
VVVSLGWLLKRNSRFLEQIRLDISASDGVVGAKVNTNEFALFK